MIETKTPSAIRLQVALDVMKIHEHELLDLRNTAIRLWYAAIREKYNLSEEGTIVRFRGKEYRVSSIERSFNWDLLNKPWVKGNPKNKDGTWSLSERNLYKEWEVVEG